MTTDTGSDAIRLILTVRSTRGGATWEVTIDEAAATPAEMGGILAGLAARWAEFTAMWWGDGEDAP